MTINSHHLSFSSIRAKCVSERYFPYAVWPDSIFIKPALWLTWLFLRLNISANAVTWLSGFFVVLGAILLSSDNKLVVFVGSFGYIIFYLLDYVDGSVARFRNTCGIPGQYLDWIIHVIASVATMAGLFAGSLKVYGSPIIPFGVLSLIASALMLARHSMAWFSICMERQQRIAKSSDLAYLNENGQTDSLPKFYSKALVRISNFIFHENYIIFWLPLLSFVNIFLPPSFIDFRASFIIFGGFIYFPSMILDIQRIATSHQINLGYRQLFLSLQKPVLPRDHFF